MKKQWLALALAAVCLLSACTTPGVGDESSTEEISTTAPVENEETTAEDTTADESLSDTEADETTAADSESTTESESESESKPEPEGTYVKLPDNGLIKDLFTSKDVYATRHSTSGEDGSIIKLNKWRSTEFVKTEGAYAVRYELTGRRSAYSVTFFDADQQFISGIGTESFCSASAVVGCTPLPEGTEYVRFTYYTGSDGYCAMEEPMAQLLATKADYDAYRSTLPLAGLKVACLGDSITEGDYGERVGAKSVHMENYPYYLAKKWGCETTNYGWCGDTAETFYNRFVQEEVDVSDADVVILILGANLGLEGELGTYYRNIVDDVRGQLKNGATLVLCVPPYNTESTRGVEGKFFLYDFVVNARPIIFALGEEYDLPVIDIFTESPIQAETESIYQPLDGIHLNREGYEVLADFIGGKLVSDVLPNTNIGDYPELDTKDLGEEDSFE